MDRAPSCDGGGNWASGNLRIDGVASGAGFSPVGFAGANLVGFLAWGGGLVTAWGAGIPRDNIFSSADLTKGLAISFLKNAIRASLEIGCRSKEKILRLVGRACKGVASGEQAMSRRSH
jgi:hypothetical protein